MNALTSARRLRPSGGCNVPVRLSTGVQIMFEPAEILGQWPEFMLEPPTEHFINCLRSVGEAVTPTGRPVHDRSTLISLTTSIASRSYSPDLYRATHVLAAAAMTGVTIDQLLLPDGPLRGSGVISLFKSGDTNKGLQVETQLLRFIDRETGAEQMKISARQLPPAIAMIEFMVEALGFEIIYQHYQEFLGAADNASISRSSKALSAALYRFLGDHLPSASGRQMAQLLSAYLIGTREEDRQIYPEDVTDAIILNFWCEYAEDETVSFRLFATAAQAWMTYRNAIELAATDAFTAYLSVDQTEEDGRQQNLSLSQSLIDSEDSAEPTPYSSSLSEVVAHANAPQQWLQDLLDEPCSTIKFFTKVEQESISLPLLAGRASKQLLLTCLRVAAFGPVQNKLVQAKRGKATSSHQTIFEQIPVAPYDKTIAQWAEMQSVTAGLCETAYFRLWEARASAFFTYFANVGTEEERQALAEISAEHALSGDAGSSVRANVDVIADAVFTALEDRSASHPLKVRRAAMKETAHRFRRKGLVPDKALSGSAQDEWLDALAIGGDRLNRIKKFLADLTTGAESRSSDLKAQFQTDTQIFRDKLMSLHGV